MMQINSAPITVACKAPKRKTSRRPKSIFETSREGSRYVECPTSAPLRQNWFN